MAHVRKVIRNHLLTALTGLVTTGANVYTNRAQAIQDANMPALTIATLSEEVDPAQGYMSCTQRRNLTVTIQAFTKIENSIPSDKLDTIAKEVEVELFTGAASLHSIVQGVELVSTNIELQEDNDLPIGIMTMEFLVFYYTVEGAPETAIT